MRLGKKTVLVCDCEGTMPLDGSGLARACGLDEEPEVYTQLCRRELDRLVGAAGTADPDLIVACTQEGVTFAEALAEAGIEAEPGLTNIRERAGWSEGARDALPKVAALLQEAALELPPVQTVSMVSNGVCLVYGSGEVVVEAARQLEGRLNVSLLLQDVEGAFPLGAMNMMVSTGVIVGAAGHLGNFEVHVNRFAPVQPSFEPNHQQQRPLRRRRCTVSDNGN